MVTMVVNVSSFVLSFALSPSLARQACRDSVWVHLVLSGRYGNLDHPLLPSRHPPPGSPLPGPLKLSPCASLLLTRSFGIPSSFAPFLSFTNSRALSFSCTHLFLTNSFRTSLFFPPAYGCITCSSSLPAVDWAAPVG